MDAHTNENRYATNDAGVPMLCNYVPDHAHRGVYATGRLPTGPMGTVAACDVCQASYARHTARLAEITAGARPAPDTAADRVRAWTAAMAAEQRTTHSISGLNESIRLDVPTVRALADGTTTPAQREQLRVAITTFLTHAAGEPRTLAQSRTPRPPLFTYDVLVLLDQHETTADCGDDDRGGPGLYEVTVFRTEMITFTLTAVSAQDAEERYLLDGDETGSDTVELRVDTIERKGAAEATTPA
ncbi:MULTISPECIES: hypothetical protein [Streptomyces]|uniref:Uncharacterized protein n=1 Tax=Streptomyces luteosporeus TaxID=173856 RepID=A0ABN3TZA9_9ACTN